jgi:hypothetical protein
MKVLALVLALSVLGTPFLKLALTFFGVWWLLASARESEEFRR